METHHLVISEVVLKEEGKSDECFEKWAELSSASLCWELEAISSLLCSDCHRLVIRIRLRGWTRWGEMQGV
jgi:hypothetical protein